MRLTHLADIVSGLQTMHPAACRPDALIISPLPNLRLEPGAAIAEFVHHPQLEPTNASGLVGGATVSRRGEELHVSVIADRPVHIGLRRRQSAGSGGGDCPAELLLIVAACGGSCSGRVSSATFHLPEHHACAVLTEADLGQTSRELLEGLSPASLLGLPTRGRSATADFSPRSTGGSEPSEPHRPKLVLADVLTTARAISDHAYFSRRVKDEISAALCAQEPGVASIHVQIATLMARRL